ncbi:S1 domain-containing protein [Mycoplasmopsis glycophila]|uniref:30S ribosomal protein s1 n=1 Tax=Mycoplasmopsis glycophila TaxID=171285 RepID=A0A449AUU9_9BACT|nr:S1 domain-containing protein [Mycoplasmopsis glycophila]VEU70268.1 30S ribosomal protein s1 [Mycoplasmopsis glycophila]
MEYKNRDIVVGKVLQVGKKFAVLETKDAARFLIYRNEISDFHKHKATDILFPNDIVNFVVLSFNNSKRQGVGSFKLNHPNYMYSPFVYKLKETRSGFRNLLNYTMGSVKEMQKENEYKKK